jgi:hypothetical protein
LACAQPLVKLPLVAFEPKGSHPSAVSEIFLIKKAVTSIK